MGGKLGGNIPKRKRGNRGPKVFPKESDASDSFLSLTKIGKKKIVYPHGEQKFSPVTSPPPHFFQKKKKKKKAISRKQIQYPPFPDTLNLLSSLATPLLFTIVQAFVHRSRGRGNTMRRRR